MGNRVEGQAPFDERAALEELERLRGQIQQYRSQRKALEEEFDRFVRSFKAPQETTGTPAPVKQVREAVAPAVPPAMPDAGPARPQQPAIEPEPAPAPQQLPAVPPDLPPARLDSPPAALDSPPAAADSPAAAPEPGTMPPELPGVAPDLPPAAPAPLPADASSRASFGAPMVIGGAVILLVAGGLVTWTVRSGGGPQPSPSALPPSATPTRAAPPEPPASAPAEAPAPRTELTTIRRVWMRVLVDGERVLEREVPADTHVPLTAEKTIVVRTGDAGAVRLSIRGRDQGFLGREGEVVTRTFTVPPVR